MKVKNYTAFTLAEILITLSIIGVIASMTIPSLVQDIQDAQFKTAWKKAYSDINQAITMVLLNNGGTMKGLCVNGDYNCFRDKVLKHLNYIKSCDTNSNNNCWNRSWKHLSNSPGWDTNTSAGAILNSGSSLMFTYDDSSCSSLGSLKWCGYIYVDVNGFKGPNMVSKDIFCTNILEKSVKPLGLAGDGYETSCSTSSNGWGCSAKYLMNKE